jgi:hypothetical protein
MPPREAMPVVKRLAGVFLLLASICLGLLALHSLPPSASPARWQGFQALLVEARVPESEVVARLETAGMREVLCESTQPVLVSNWAGLETMSLAAARARLVPGDARSDSYLLHLGLWFEAESGGQSFRSYYIKQSPAFVAGRLGASALDRAMNGLGARYMVQEEGLAPALGRGRGTAFLFVVFLLAAACLAGPLVGRGDSLSRGLAARKPLRTSLSRILFRLLLALPWALLAWGSSPALAALWGLAVIETADSLDLPIDEVRRGRGMQNVLSSLSGQAAPALALPFVALLAAVASIPALPSLVLAGLGSLIVIPGFVLALSRASARRGFIPLPIARSSFFSRRGVSAASKVRAVLACGALVLWALGRLLPPSLGQTSSPDMAIPLPLAAQGSVRPLIAEARQRATTETGALLPGLSSWLEHRAIQEALPFVRLGEARPDPFAPAALPVPQAGSRAGTSPQGIEFTDGWARSAYSAIPALSVEAMLLGQGFPAVARLGLPGLEGRRPLAPIEYLLYIFLLIPPIGRILFGTPESRGAASSDLRQEA